MSNYPRRKRHRPSPHKPPNSDLPFDTTNIISTPDVISQLPDCLLATILSYLPIKTIVSTSALSHRWKNIWTITPLTLNLSDLSPLRPFGLSYPQRVARCVNAFNSILLHHHGPILGFHLLDAFLFNDLDDKASVVDFDGRMRALMAKGIQELTLTMSNYSLYAVPECMFECQTLRSLQLVFASFRLSDVPRPCFVNLRELTLVSCLLKHSSVHDLLASCVSLQRLALINCSLTTFGQEKVKIRVSSHTLGGFTLKSICWWEIEELVIEDAPNLECLTLSVGMTHYFAVKVLNAPKLETLGYLSTDMVKLEFRKMIHNKHILLDCSRTQVFNVKSLAMAMNLNTIDKIPKFFELLRCFPQLETLEIRCEETTRTDDKLDFTSWEEESFDCLENHLNVVKLKCFSRTRNDIFLAIFLLKKARVLTTMDLTHTSNWAKEKQDKIKTNLLEHRASPDAQINISSCNSIKNELPTWASVLKF